MNPKSSMKMGEVNVFGPNQRFLSHHRASRRGQWGLGRQTWAPEGTVNTGWLAWWRIQIRAGEGGGSHTAVTKHGWGFAPHDMAGQAVWTNSTAENG